MKPCPSCQHQIDPGAGACPNCGRTFTNPLHIVIAVAFVAAVILAMTFR